MQLILQFLQEFLMLFLYPIVELVEFLTIRKVIHPENTRGKTIIIVERWFNRNFYHKRWKQYLEKKGYTVFYVHTSLHKGNFISSARVLQHMIEQHDLKDITLVGISNGGLSAFLYLQELDGWKRVTRFIAIGVPFRGTYLSLFLFFMKSCRELWPHSTFMRKISGMQILHPKQIICLRAKMDEIVPVWSSHIPGSRRTVINVYGHNNLHFRCKATYDAIIRYTED